ncbi:MAG: Xaa-Pro peptidase family protein [Trueperaceae bacterium]
MSLTSEPPRVRRLEQIQAELQRQELDGWLLYDFRRSNPGAQALIRPLLEGNTASRRVLLFVPATGTPTLAVHAIERGSLREDLPVKVVSYASREDFDATLKNLVGGLARVAMEYSPGGDNPYIGTVDAGTVERVRATGVEVVSSGDVAQVLELWSEQQLDDHLTAAAGVIEAKDAAFQFLAGKVQAAEQVSEAEVQAVIEAKFAELGLVTGSSPNVSFGAHAGDPHYHPLPGVRDAVLQPGDVVLIDLWAKVDAPDAPYADVTWMGVTGAPSARLLAVWEAVREARDVAFKTIASAYAAGRWPTGAEADRAARAVLEAAGLGDAFTHRTGHSLGTRTTHGAAAHLDDFETADTRLLMPGLGLTIEPGAYFDDFGVRSEINLYVGADGPVATTELQSDLERL